MEKQEANQKNQHQNGENTEQESLEQAKTSVEQVVSSIDLENLEEKRGTTEDISDIPPQEPEKPMQWQPKTTIKTESTGHSNAEQSSEPTEKPQKKTKRIPLSFKCNDALKERFREEAKKFEDQETFFIHLMENFLNPPTPPEPRVEVEIREKTIEVEKQLQPGEHIVKLSEAEEKALGLISINRMRQAGKQNPPGFGAVKAESFGEILRKSFFNQSRLFNLDNTFYTGLSKKDLVK